MENEQIIHHNGYDYEYDNYYKRLQIVDKLTAFHPYEVIPHILCPICKSDTFKLQYGVYELNAICGCGHRMTVYDG